MWTLRVHFCCGVPPPPLEKGVFTSYWLIAANSDHKSWKWGIVRGTQKCPKTPAQAMGLASADQFNRRRHKQNAT
jgi:hypothetical protein